MAFMATATATKRMRADADEGDSEGSNRTAGESTVSKAQRLDRRAAAEASSSKILCTLPPTCNPPHNRPFAVLNVQELESHYAKYHAFVCEEHRCGAVFPGQRLLELHQTECHDPIAYERMKRGEKIFACHLADCPKLFGTPKNRRLHLIQAHQFPKQYFFAVTNKGVGGLLRKWGEGASMVRGAWKPREDEESETDEPSLVESDGEDICGEEPLADHVAAAGDSTPTPAGSTEVDTLTSAMNSLAIIPPTLRFGRGARMSRPFGSMRRGKSSIAAAMPERPNTVPKHRGALTLWRFHGMSKLSKARALFLVQALSEAEAPRDEAESRPEEGA